MAQQQICASSLADLRQQQAMRSRALASSRTPRQQPTTTIQPSPPFCWLIFSWPCTPTSPRISPAEPPSSPSCAAQPRESPGRDLLPSCRSGQQQQGDSRAAAPHLLQAEPTASSTCRPTAPPRQHADQPWNTSRPAITTSPDRIFSPLQRRSPQRGSRPAAPPTATARSAAGRSPPCCTSLRRQIQQDPKRSSSAKDALICARTAHQQQPIRPPTGP